MFASSAQTEQRAGLKAAALVTSHPGAGWAGWAWPRGMGAGRDGEESYPR